MPSFNRKSERPSIKTSSPAVTCFFMLLPPRQSIPIRINLFSILRWITINLAYFLSICPGEKSGEEGKGGLLQIPSQPKRRGIYPSKRPPRSRQLSPWILDVGWLDICLFFATTNHTHFPKYPAQTSFGQSRFAEGVWEEAAGVSAFSDLVTSPAMCWCCWGTSDDVQSREAANHIQILFPTKHFRFVFARLLEGKVVTIKIGLGFSKN